MDGLSHVVHSEEEAIGTRITIDSLTCLLANESDPSRLVAMSPGKLVRYLVEDGTHVDMDQPYAEVEVGSVMLLLTSCNTSVWDIMMFSRRACLPRLVKTLSLECWVAIE